MLDRSISRRYSWKVQGWMAVLKYAAAWDGGVIRLRSEAAKNGRPRMAEELPSGQARKAGELYPLVDAVDLVIR